MLCIKPTDTRRPTSRHASPSLTLVAAAVGTAVRSGSIAEVGACSLAVVVLASGTSVGPTAVLVSGSSVRGISVLAWGPPVGGPGSLVGIIIVLVSGSTMGGRTVLVSGGGLVSTTVVEVTPVDGGVGGGVTSSGVDSADVIVVVVSMRPPPRVGTAYGGSKRPNRPHALHGEAHDLTVLGATRIGSHLPSGFIVAISVGSTLWGQSVPRSFKVSCRVISSPGTIVDISSKSAAKTGLEAAGPALPAELVP